jgi:hypothetical protein
MTSRGGFHLASLNLAFQHTTHAHAPQQASKNFVPRVFEALQRKLHRLMGAYPLLRNLTKWAKNMRSAIGDEAGAKHTL